MNWRTFYSNEFREMIMEYIMIISEILNSQGSSLAINLEFEGSVRYAADFLGSVRTVEDVAISEDSSVLGNSGNRFVAPLTSPGRYIYIYIF